MRVRTAKDVGLLIRERRNSLRLTQSELARRLGVSRQWISQIEGGKQRADIALVLRTLATLGMTVDVRSQPVSPGSPDPEPTDVDEIVRRARRNRS